MGTNVGIRTLQFVYNLTATGNLVGRLDQHLQSDSRRQRRWEAFSLEQLINFHTKPLWDRKYCLQFCRWESEKREVRHLGSSSGISGPQDHHVPAALTLGFSLFCGIREKAWDNSLFFQRKYMQSQEAKLCVQVNWKCRYMVINHPYVHPKMADVGLKMTLK